MSELRRASAWAFCVALVFGVLARGTLAYAAGTLPPAGDYAVDAAGSGVGFNVTHFVISSVDGNFRTFSGRVRVGDSLGTTHIEATVDTRSVDTGNGSRDEHLRSADFLETARFPTMTFTSTMLWGTPDNFGIKGNLTIKGLTKEVVFTARILDTGVIVAETKIDRTAFGVTYTGPVNQEVRMRLKIRLTAAPGP